MLYKRDFLIDFQTLCLLLFVDNFKSVQKS